MNLFTAPERDLKNQISKSLICIGQWSLFNPIIIIHAFQYRDLYYTCNDNYGVMYTL